MIHNAESDKWSTLFMSYAQNCGLPLPIPNHPFRSKWSKWEFSLAYPDKKLGIIIYERNRGYPVICDKCGKAVHHIVDKRREMVRDGGKLCSNVGMSKDCEKRNAALFLGWRILYFTPDMIRTGYAVKVVKEFLKMTV